MTHARNEARAAHLFIFPFTARASPGIYRCLFLSPQITINRVRNLKCVDGGNGEILLSHYLYLRI